ncbi:MAG: Gfo/Idh/MocA family oxidoreductase [Armatimonadota bacterium]|nr:Gfo/Idh/MocA family oxidoreductase [Armatimonadota bacterium]
MGADGAGRDGGAEERSSSEGQETTVEDLAAERVEAIGAEAAEGLDALSLEDRLATAASRREGRVGYACVGCGSIANNYHLPALQRIPEAEFVVACDILLQRARETAERFDAQHAITQYQQALEREDVDLVCVFTKVDSHAEIAIDAAWAGKDVFIQKPFALSVAEGRQMIQAARDNEVEIIPSFMHRYFDEALTAAELVRDGAVGKLQFMRQRNATRNPPEIAPDYGGAMMDIGAHGIDLIRAITGEEIVRVMARLGGGEGPPEGEEEARDERDLRGGETNAFMLYALASGATVAHEVQWAQAAGASRFTAEVYGTHGTLLLRAPRIDTELAYFSAAGMQEPHRARVEWEVPELPGRPFGAAQHEAVIDSLLTDEWTAQTAQDGLAVLRVCEAARQSAVSGCWEDVLE